MNKFLSVLVLTGLLVGCGDGMLGSSDAESDTSTEYKATSESSSDVTTAPDSTLVDSGSVDVGGSEEGEGTIQAGTLTSGDYDDLLNPHLYSDYLGKVLQNSSDFSDFSTVDTLNQVILSITDTDNMPLGGAAVEISFSDVSLQYVTPNSGKIHLFPGYEQLANDLTISVVYNDELTQSSISLSDITDNTIAIQVDQFSALREQLDLMIVFDATGSMGDELAYLKVELASILSELSVGLGGVDLQLGVVLYKDIGDDYVTRVFDLSTDVDNIVAELENQSYGGGGDYPEAMDQGINMALTQQWRNDSTKMMLLIADAPPHDDELLTTWNLGLQARSEQIHIIPVAASGVSTKAEFIMRGLALLTHSRYLFLTDDSGVGGSHEEPDVTCYIVTRLDSNIRRVIQDLFTGTRSEPLEEEIIRKTGEYENGVCAPLEE